MKSNTQNKKIEAITEKTLVIGIDVEVKHIMQGRLTTEALSIQRNHLSLVTQGGRICDILLEWILDLKKT